MKYTPVLPEYNDNVSHNNPLRELCILLSGVLAIFIIAYWLLGFCVDFAVDYLPPEKEKVLFSGFQIPWPEDAKHSAQQTKIQAIADGMSECVDVGYPIKVNIVDDPMINALALPGGTVVIFSGLIDKMKSENALSFVLAHELGHFKNRDHLKGMGRGIVLTIISSLLIGADSNISKMLVPTGYLQQAQYSRSRESKADTIALHTLNCYYGHVGGATDFFETLLEEKITPEQTKVSQYFASHPPARERIKQLDTLSREMGFEKDSTTAFATQ